MIDKIDGLGSVRSTQPVKRTAKPGSTGSTSFAKHLDEGSEVSGSGSVGNTNAVGGILGVQEVDDALSRASKGKMRAEDILDRLDDLRLELLSGGISRDKLMQLSRIVNAQRAKVTDPKLAALLDDIDLRAQVELAKHSQS
ncbi:MAG: flagellar assembly protein FliX [Alphaproteobacteria bacterium]